MSEALRERVARALWEKDKASYDPDFDRLDSGIVEHFCRTADAAIAIVLEEAAKTGRQAVMDFKRQKRGRYYPGYHEDMREHIASAIRSMKNEQ